jgi:hypothetical protein
MAERFAHGIAFVLNIVTSFANLWAFLWRNTIGAAILWLWHNVWEPAASGIATAAMWLWHNVIEPTARGIAAAAQAIGSAAMWLWHNAIDPAFHGVAASPTGCGTTPSRPRSTW